MKKHICTVETNEITCKDIWKLMSDVENWNLWDNGIEYSKLNGEFKTGGTITLKPKNGPKVKLFLDEVRSPEYFKDSAKFPLAVLYDEHIYEDTENGLKITSILTIKGALSILWYHLVMKDMVKNIESDIKKQIEHAKLIK